MTSTSGSAATEQVKGVGTNETLSQFISRVLSQLSLSAWLPAVVLIVGTTTLTGLYFQSSWVNAVKAVVDDGARLGASLVALSLTIVFVAMIIQAFALRCIQWLEGYWGSTRVSLLLTRYGIWRQHGRRRRLNRARRKRAAMARQVAEMIMQKEGLKQKDIRKAMRVKSGRESTWRLYCPAKFLQPLESTETALEYFPERHRILPTRLGNTLRSYEDKLSRAGGQELSGFILRRGDAISTYLTARHDDARNRLDLYCTLFFVFCFLGGESALILGGNDLASIRGPWLILLFLFLAWTCNRAAIETAKRYGVILLEINREIPET